MTNEDVKLFDFSQQWNYLLSVLRVRRWTLVTFFIATAVVVTVGTSLQTPTYEATASVLIDTELPSVLTISTQRDDSTVGQTNYLTYADYYRTQLEIIQSRRIAKQVYRNLKLEELPEHSDHPDPIAHLLKKLRIEPIKQTRMVKIHIEDSQPKNAAMIANEFALVFVANNLERGATTEAMTLIKNEYLKLQSKEAELTKRYKDKYPAVVRVRKQMKQLSLAIEEELQKQLKSNEGNVSQSADQNLLTQDQHLDDESDLLQQIRGDSVASRVRPNNIRIQDFAQVPVKRHKPSLLLNCILGLFLGIFGSIGVAFLEEMLDSTVKVPEDIERESNFSYLGLIPQMTTEPETKKKGKRAAEKERYLQLLENPNSQASEFYRNIRTSFLYSAPKSTTKATVITSPSSGEGKTSTAINLALSLAQVGNRVLLVDADLRKPSLHKAFDFEKEPGLSEYLTDRASLKEILKDSPTSSLKVVTSGVMPPNPAELLGLPKMKEFLDEASLEFDQIILDTPPVIPVSDALVLSAIAQSILIVAYSGKTPRQALRRLEIVCKNVQAKVLGVILNGVINARVPYYGYGKEVYEYKPDSSDKKNDKYV